MAAALGTTPSLLLTLKDAGRLSDKFIGSASIALAPLLMAAGKVLERSLPLAGHSGEGSIGSVVVRAVFVESFVTAPAVAASTTAAAEAAAVDPTKIGASGTFPVGATPSDTPLPVDLPQLLRRLADAGTGMSCGSTPRQPTKVWLPALVLECRGLHSYVSFCVAIRLERGCPTAVFQYLWYVLT